MRGFLLIFSLVCWSGLSAQPSETPPAFQKCFQSHRHYAFQEKVYLHTDKSAYVAGEKIWFRAYRTDATTHIPDVYSKYVYVELFNDRNELVERLKVMEQDGCFHGSFPLDPYLPSGRYMLRAYTYWMQNFDDGFYFSKEIRIENSVSHSVNHEIRWSRDVHGLTYAHIRFTDSKGAAFPLYADCRFYCGDKQVYKNIERADKQGWLHYPLRRKDSVTSLRVQFLDKKPVEYQVTFLVPPLGRRQALDVCFFPEGGHLLGGQLCRMSFKAVGGDGYGVDVFGNVYRDDGEFVSAFMCSHLGMGRFDFTPDIGRSYYAVVDLPDGGEKRVDLPAVETEGIVLCAEVRDSVLHYVWRGTAGYLSGRRLSLLVHSRGDLLWAVDVDSLCSVDLPLSGVPPGIVHGVLVDGSGRVYSERLSFVYPDAGELLGVSADRDVCRQRDSVKLSLCLKGGTGLSCSVSVTDSLLAPRVRWSNDIRSYFLLSSDLRGHVESPGWYFDEALPFRFRRSMLDVLLSTQGWTRFDVGGVCRNERDSLPFFLELSQGFSGRIKNFWGRMLKDGKLFVIAPRIGLAESLRPDSAGRFELNVRYPDSTVFVFQAMGPRRGKLVDLELTTDSLRPPGERLLPAERFPLQSSSDSSVVPEALGSMRPVVTKGYYYEDGRKVYLLEEARVVKKQHPFKYEHWADQILEARDLKAEKYTTLLDWIRTIPRVDIIHTPDGERQIGYAWNGEVSKPVICEINGMEINARDRGGLGLLLVDMLELVDIKTVERVAYIMDYKSLISGDLWIVIDFKKGYSLWDFSNRGDFFQLTPLGYHVPSAFYQPKYEMEEERGNPEPDERPTLYWNPDVRLDSLQPEKQLQFYTSDTGGPYEVVVEGITKDGQVVRVVKIIR